jgi:hypothetical protein
VPDVRKIENALVCQSEVNRSKIKPNGGKQGNGTKQDEINEAEYFCRPIIFKLVKFYKKKSFHK